MFNIVNLLVKGNLRYQDAGYNDKKIKKYHQADY